MKLEKMKMDAQRERIATLLVAGLLPAQVATIVGVAPGRISQIMKEEDFALFLSAKEAENKDVDIEEVSLSGKYLAAEHALLAQVLSMAPSSELRDVTAALRVVAERQERAKSRMNPIVQQAPVYNTIVSLSLPAHAVPELTFSGTKEVIAIENRNLAPLSSKGVLSLFKDMAAHKDDPTDAISNTSDGENHEPTRTLAEATGSPAESLPFQEPIEVENPSSGKLAEGARRFLDSLHPAPSALQY